jgi:hypothetical protein
MPPIPTRWICLALLKSIVAAQIVEREKLLARFSICLSAALLVVPIRDGLAAERR